MEVSGISPVQSVNHVPGLYPIVAQPLLAVLLDFVFVFFSCEEETSLCAQPRVGCATVSALGYERWTRASPLD